MVTTVFNQFKNLYQTTLVLILFLLILFLLTRKRIHVSMVLPLITCAIKKKNFFFLWAEESVLVFKYVPNGNLQDKLHTARARRRRRRRGGGGGGRKIAAGAGGDDEEEEEEEEEEEGVLSWNSRIKIAFQLAQALEYLHHKCPLQIVHGDIKASNILLDHHLNCKLCDFGSARMGFASSVLPSPSSSSSAAAASRKMFGSPGYTDPHYLRTGIASRKNDVYSFGVILLELITGREALCSRTGHKLTSIAAPALRDPSKLPQLLDPRLLRDEEDGPELLEQVKVMASISAMCLCDSPALRPSASDILNAIAATKNNISSSLSFSSPPPPHATPNKL